MQSLRRLISLCSPCHQDDALLGYANVTGRTDEALAHLRKVRGLTLAEALAHVHAAEDVWIERSTRLWELDLSILTNVGIAVRRPERPAERPAAAERALAREAGPPAVALARPSSAELAPPHPAAPTTRPRGLWSRLTGRDS